MYFFAKGPSTHGEEFVDEVSTKCQRIVDEVSAKDFSSPAKFFLPKNFAETSSTKNFYVILIFFAKACPLAFKNYRKKLFRRKKLI